MVKSYTTISGDTWDSIAKKVYGNEKFVTYLMENNKWAVNIFTFPSGLMLYIPPLPKDDVANLPDWRL